ncbi:MAG: quinol:cytochrome C oxidoreductase, partial [Candidatus Kapaibacterium sp.]
LAIPIIMNMHGLFHWTHMEDVIADPFLSKKVPYLNEPFFIIRTLIFFVVMILFFFVLAGRSLKQDKTGDYRHTKTNKVASALFMPFFAIFTTIIAIDYLMTLEPHWFSTIFGVYYFAGTFLAALAVLTYVSVTLSEAGYMTKYINNDHYYNFGALMFAFVNFWAYIAFSQFLLIWYANIPEETFWFIDRWQGSWMWVTIGLIFIHFIVPYAVLLSQPSKRNPKVLKFISIWIIIAHFYDLYWIVMPTYSHDNAILGWMELMVPILPVGLLLVVFNFMAKRKNLIPVNDPKIKSGLRFRL